MPYALLVRTQLQEGYFCGSCAMHHDIKTRLNDSTLRNTKSKTIGHLSNNMFTYITLEVIKIEWINFLTANLKIVVKDYLHAQHYTRSKKTNSII